MKNMKKAIVIIVCVCSLGVSATTHKEVIDIINKVNARWQTQHPVPANAFWHSSAYHMGNMAAYKATGNSVFLQYSDQWAEANNWKGAISTEKDKWKYTYGETEEYVLFGDWQICFQVYADLYSIHPDKRKIERALEVMEYQMSTPNNDYWWWADGLYMVMPVMTRLYRITGNPKYLDKLYEYFSYARDLMYDKDSNLFYRDSTFVYPNHKTANGNKDFWARGNGWGFAALAQVLKDLPNDNFHRSEYVEIFCKMAKSLKACQQPGGYWARSLTDPQFVPGYETSGTAFFTYGFLWGVNNGILDETEYISVIKGAWSYLSKIALQQDGTVGYVQPIGGRADQHRNVNSKTTADFGVGAFLLAASEMSYYLIKDRKLWVDLLYKIAAPVLSNMSQGNLKKNMQVELSPIWDNRPIDVTYMEAFGRTMAGVAPWLSLPDDDTEEGKKRKQVRDWALKSYINAVNPESPDYLFWRERGQPLVDAAYIAESFLRAYDALWTPLDDTTKQRYIEEFTQLRRVNPPYTNWLLFSAAIEAFLMKIEADPDMYRIHSAIRKVNEWYVGDGWYSDGSHFAFDYYNSYVIHPIYIEVLQEIVNKNRKMTNQTLEQTQKQLEVAWKRTQRFGVILERLISPEGTFPAFGRSVTYRTGALQPLALLAWQKKLPQELSFGRVRAALTSVMRHMFLGNQNFNEGQFLSLGFNGKQDEIADTYTNNGSLYMASLAFLPLGLPANHPFWTSFPESWTQKKAWREEDFPRDHTYYE